MADSKRFCSECFLPVPPGWNERYCPNCGGRIKYRIVKKRSQSQARPMRPAEAEEGKKEPKKPRLTRKIARPDIYNVFTTRGKTILGPRFLRMSPVLLFVLNVLTLGIRSILWMRYHLRSIIMMAKTEEKNIMPAIYVWLFSYGAGILLLIPVFLILLSNSASPAEIASFRITQGAAAFLGLSFLTGRHILFWSREAIIDELLKSDLDAIRSRAVTFAPSTILMWYIGVPYIQTHINRMIKKKGLNSYSSSRRSRAVNAPPPERKKKQGSEQAPEPLQEEQ